jgi:nitrogen regulatory protein PII
LSLGTYIIPSQIEDIKTELEKAGHKVCNIMNVKTRVTKESISLFFVDLEPQYTNREIFKEFLYNTKITIEAPKKT